MTFRPINPTPLRRLHRVSWLIAIVACSSPSQAPTSTAASSNVKEVMECSYIGKMACNAKAMVTGEGVNNSTCTATRSGSTRIETCGSTTVAAVAPKPSAAAPTKPIAEKPPATSERRTGKPVTLSWKDNSKDEKNFVIERCDQVTLTAAGQNYTAKCIGAWKQIGIVGANVTTYTDATVTANQTYLYRIKAVNDAGSSAPTAQAAITVQAR